MVTFICYYFLFSTNVLLLSEILITLHRSQFGVHRISPPLPPADPGSDGASPLPGSSCTPVLLYSCTPVLLYSCTPVLLYSYSPVLLYSCNSFPIPPTARP